MLFMNWQNEKESLMLYLLTRDCCMTCPINFDKLYDGAVTLGTTGLSGIPGLCALGCP